MSPCFDMIKTRWLPFSLILLLYRDTTCNAYVTTNEAHSRIFHLWKSDSSVKPFSSSPATRLSSSFAELSSRTIHVTDTNYIARKIRVLHVEPIRMRSSSPGTCLSAKNSDDTATEDDVPQQDYGQQILNLALPALASLSIDPLMSLVDTIFVGQYSDSPAQLAGVGSSTAILTFSFYIFNFLCTATTPLVASLRGQDKEQEARDLGRQALSLAIGLGVALCLVLVSQRDVLLGIIMGGKSSSLAIDVDVSSYQYAQSFLTIRAFSAPAVFIMSASTGILRGYLDTKTPIFVLFAANFLNLSLDIGLISILGLPAPKGAAIATTTAEWFSALGFLGVLGGILPSANNGGEAELGSNQQPARALQSKNEKDYDNQSFSKNENLTIITPTLSVPSFSTIQPLLLASSSLFLRTIVLQGALTGAAAMAARDGLSPSGASIAAHQIAIQIWLLSSFICDALAAASQGLVADALGRKDPRDVREISNTVFRYSAVLGLGLSALFAIGANVGLNGEDTGVLVQLFTKDAETQQQLAPLLNIIVLTQPLNALVFAADGVLQGASQFTYQAKCMAISVGVAVASFGVLETAPFNSASGGSDILLHVWIALVVLQFMRGLTSYIKIIDPDGPITLLSGQ